MAFWGSPLDTSFGWKEWCYSEDIGVNLYNWEYPIIWHLEYGSKILKVGYEDVIIFDDKTMPWDINIRNRDMSVPNDSVLLNYVKDSIFQQTNADEKIFDLYRYELDFDKMLKDNITAVWLQEPELGRIIFNPLAILFNSWDCESIVVLDESKIIFD